MRGSTVFHIRIEGVASIEEALWEAVSPQGASVDCSLTDGATAVRRRHRNEALALGYQRDELGLAC